jgi:hypothetical protein
VLVRTQTSNSKLTIQTSLVAKNLFLDSAKQERTLRPRWIDRTDARVVQPLFQLASAMVIVLFRTLIVSAARASIYFGVGKSFQAAGSARPPALPPKVCAATEIPTMNEQPGRRSPALPLIRERAHERHTVHESER